jgi:hypothetical protein
MTQPLPNTAQSNWQFAAGLLSLSSSPRPTSLHPPPPPPNVPQVCPNAPTTPTRRQRRYHGSSSRTSSTTHPFLPAELQGPEGVQRKILQTQKEILGIRGGPFSTFLKINLVSQLFLQQKYKDLEDELRRSGERNTNWNTERGYAVLVPSLINHLNPLFSMLLDRILELEASVARQPSTPSPLSPDTPPPPTQPPTAFPRALQSAHAQTAFQANLQEAFDEIRSEDSSVDPLYTSRHIGPQARKRQLDEMKEREEEEARDARKTPRRGKAAPNASKAKDTGVPTSFPPSTNNSGGPTTAPGASPQTLVAPSGKRIRIKPPSAAPPEPAPPRPAGQAMHRIPQFINNAGVPQTAHQLSPGSPMSPLGSDAEPYAVADGESSTPLRNGNGALETPNHTGPGSPTSLGPSAASIPQTTVQRHTKPKRLKAHTVTSKSYSIPMVPRDKTGRPILPLNVGIMTVNCLGEVCMREHFHTERYIFPVGYSVNR